MPAVQTFFADPRAITVDGEYGTWILSGVATNRLRDVVVDADGIAPIVDDLQSRTEDAVVVFIAPADGGGRVTAFRSATSSRDLFYLEGSDGTVVFSDHYRNAVAQLDRGDRHLDRTAVVDHLLFRSPVPPATLIDEIGRLGRGDVLAWDGDDDEWTRVVVDELSATQTNGPDTAVQELDTALAETIRRGVRPDARTMLSGGVDSTLLASYRRDPPPPRQIVVDSPEFQSEVERGRNAAERLGRELATTTVAESAFRDHLEAAVDRLGLPPRYSQTVFTAGAFESWPSTQYVNGQAADALYGLQGVKAARFASWLGPLATERVAGVVSSVSPDRFGDAVGALACRRRQLDRKMTNPNSLVHALSADVDAEAVADVFDAATVRDRARRRVSYAMDRCTLDADTGFGRAVAAGHLLDFLDDDAVNQWRQLGFVDGHDVVAPFRTRRVAETALAVPAERRYIQGRGDLRSLSTKYIPKRLVGERVPEYAVNQAKGDGSLPLERYRRDGPLASFFDRYDPPAFVDSATVADHVGSYGSLTWPVMTYCVWRDRVLHASDIPEVPGTDVQYHRVAQSPSPPPA